MASQAWFFLLCASLLSSTAVWCNEELEVKDPLPTPSLPGLPSPSSLPPPAAPTVEPLPPPAPPVQPLPPPAPPVQPLPPPSPPIYKPPLLPPVTSLKECAFRCGGRCQLNPRTNRCLRACMTCCSRCKCVPPGTYGNREQCGSCYTDMITHGDRLKCP